MLMKTLRYRATCADCGADLPAGTVARLYRRRGRRGWVAYGRDCHQSETPVQERASDSAATLAYVEAQTGEAQW